MIQFFRSSLSLNSSIRRTYHYIRGMIAFWVSGNPAKDMIVIGITGTKGKTTTANMVARGLRHAGHKVAMFSTTNMMIDGTEMQNNMKMTTPSPFVLWDFIKQARMAGVTHLIIETSSHALYYNRVYGLHFDVAVLTNIAQDHLDLHKTMENYIQTKVLLFKNLYKYGIRKGIKKVSVVNLDHPYADAFTSRDIVTDNLYTVGLSPQAGVRAENITFTEHGMEFDVKIPSNVFHLSTKLYGEFNVSNILCAVAVLMSQQVDIATITQIVRDFDTVPGRLEDVPNNRGVKILVDYAHTEDSLRSVLKTAKKFTESGKVVVVFGATGDRDKDKRPLMGAVAHEYADSVIVTDDDTYTEDSLSIIRDIMRGIPRKEGENFWIIPSRADAIRTALLMLKKNDVLIVAGKGAETVQVTQSGPIPWNDKTMILSVLDEIETQVLLEK